MSAGSVVAAIPSWNPGAAAVECVRSLAMAAHPRLEILVVDNGSTDGSVAAMRQAVPQAQVIELGENLGFTGAANVALAWSRRRGADYCLLVNDDAVLAADCIPLLVEALAQDPLAAAAAPTIYFHDRPQVIWSAGGTIDWRRGATAMIGMDQIEDGQFGREPRRVVFVCGCVLLLRLDAVERIGAFDPRFFAYYEDVEWCVRAGRSGAHVLHVPCARAWHRITPEARAGSDLVHYYMTRNRLLFLQCAGAAPEAWARTLVLEYMRTLLSWTLRPRWRGKQGQRRAMVQALLDFRRRRLGRAPLQGA